MNAALAGVLLTLVPHAAVLRDAEGVDEYSQSDFLYDMCDANASIAIGLKRHGDDNSTWAQRMESDEAHPWCDVCSKDQEAQLRQTRRVPGGQRGTVTIMESCHKKAFEVIDMMWVLKKRKKGQPTQIHIKYKARSCVLQTTEKRALNSGIEHSQETFAPAARSATFKLLCAVECIVNLRVKQFDVDAAYLQGQFVGNYGDVYVPLPPSGESYDDGDSDGRDDDCNEDDDSDSSNGGSCGDADDDGGGGGSCGCAKDVGGGDDEEDDKHGRLRAEERVAESAHSIKVSASLRRMRATANYFR
eukprot:4290902-Pleurochrysis_carterae.AAC.4